ncbi:MAG: electron transfer flavoprotein subunit beta/FixA family protein [Clostridiales Family XIII bacterium]|jgi:electron transfer flavoprotein beta subunit|nr:electron transfer flavoprotein subunit beta/FixA family protein [Clostridiales Family XIII bacterium]
MNIVVSMKQTFDTEATITLSNGKINSAGVELVINPYDEFALEEALKLKEAAGEGEVVLVSVGGEGVNKALRTGLAMGADRAVLIDDPALADADEWAVAVALAKAIGQIEYDIVLAGRMAIDDGSSQVAVRLADTLGLPSVTSVIKLDIDGTKATATKEIDGGTEDIEVALPAVFTAQKGLNEPRLPSMAGIMKSKKKEIKSVTLADLGFGAGDLLPKTNVVEFSLPSPRSGGHIVDGEPADAAKELARLLREEAKAI